MLSALCLMTAGLLTSGLVTTVLVASSGPAGASAGTDQAQITQLEQRISEQGANVESLVSKYNAVEERIGALDAQIADDDAVVASDRHAETAASRLLQRVAVDAYTGAEAGSSALMLFSDTSTITTTGERSEYLGAVNGKWNNVLTSLHLDQARTREDGKVLQTEQDQAKATLDQLSSAHHAANAAMASDEALLHHVRGNLRAVLAAAQEQHEAHEEAEERALAAASAARAQPPLPEQPPPTTPTAHQPPVPVTPPVQGPRPSPGVYANPLRGASALSPERIDQGVDYSGFGPIYAIGDGVVLSTLNGGWPGGTFIAYQLTDGPASGLVVYAAEDIEPSVQVGATVTSSTVLGQIFAGPDGIETGWADGSALGNTMARTFDEFQGANSTAFGYNFSQLLESLGAPGGVLQNNPPTGTLPSNWPQW